MLTRLFVFAKAHSGSIMNCFPIAMAALDACNVWLRDLPPKDFP